MPRRRGFVSVWQILLAEEERAMLSRAAPKYVTVFTKRSTKGRTGDGEKAPPSSRAHTCSRGGVGTISGLSAGFDVMSCHFTARPCSMCSNDTIWSALRGVSSNRVLISSMVPSLD
jgi:hypothetical protein